MTTTSTPLLLQFWTTLTPVQRAILASAAEPKAKPQDVAERTARLEEACNADTPDRLICFACDLIEEQLENQGSSATLDSVMAAVMAFWKNIMPE